LIFIIVVAIVNMFVINVNAIAFQLWKLRSCAEGGVQTPAQDCRGHAAAFGHSLS
jgi:hypothetical protein